MALHGPIQKNADYQLVYSDSAPQLRMSGTLQPKSGDILVTAKLFKGRSSGEPSIVAFFENGKSMGLQGKFDPNTQTYSATLQNPSTNRIVQLQGEQKLDDGGTVYGHSSLSVNGVAKADQAEMYSPDGGFAIGQPGKSIVTRTLVCLSLGEEVEGSNPMVQPVNLSFATGGNSAAFVVKFLLTGAAKKELGGPNSERMVILQRLSNGQVVQLKSFLHKEEGVIAALAEQPGTFAVGYKS
jgi:hypothetical protein